MKYTKLVAHFAVFSSLLQWLILLLKAVKVGSFLTLSSRDLFAKLSLKDSDSCSKPCAFACGSLHRFYTLTLQVTGIFS